MSNDHQRSVLAEAFQARLDALPSTISRLNRGLLDRFDMRKQPSDDWAGRFSDLTLLYPALHAELAGLDRADVDAVGLAHAWFIVHTFVEDRLRDGQIPDPGSGMSFVSVCLSEGLLQLHAAGCLTDSVRGTMRRYYEAADTPYLGDAETGSHDLTDERVIEIASGRAAFGWIATEAMLTTAGVAPNVVADLARAFDLTVTGMQWVDDVSDWHEDLSTRDDNLLLVGLAHRFGLDAYALPENELRSPNVAHALLTNGMFASAEEHAIDCFASAQEIFQRHKLRSLAELLGKRIEAAGQVRQQEETVCNEVVDTALKLFGSE